MITHATTCEFTPECDMFFSREPSDHGQTMRISAGGVEVSVRGADMGVLESDSFMNTRLGFQWGIITHGRSQCA